MLDPIEIPEILLEKVKNDVTVNPVPEEKKFSRMDEINNSLIVKLFMDSKTQQSFVVNKLEETILGLREKAKALFGFEAEDHNWRLRRYNKTEDSMHEVFGEFCYEKCLHDLGMRQTCYLIVEIKKQDEVFQEYDPKNITVKVNVWRDNLTILTKQYLKPIKVGIREENTFGEFYEKVRQLTNIQNPLLIKRNFSVGNPFVVYELEENREKTLISLRFFNGINLYAEEN